MKHENLNGRVAVVTGGGGVLCGDFSKVLAKQGVKVAVLDLNEAAAQKVVDDLSETSKMLDEIELEEAENNNLPS